MVDLMARYLSFNKQLSLQHIGTFSVEHLPAQLDFPNRLLLAPQALLHFSVTSNADEAFEQWLCESCQLSVAEAKNRLKDLVNDFQHTISKGQAVEWKGIGIFTKDENQLLHFTSLFAPGIGEPVKAEKIIRKNAAHFVRVGEEEKTNTEMEELLFGEKKKGINSLWIVATALLLTCIAAIWYFASAYPSSWKTQGNNQPLKMKEPPALYKIQ